MISMAWLVGLVKLVRLVRLRLVGTSIRHYTDYSCADLANSPPPSTQLRHDFNGLVKSKLSLVRTLVRPLLGDVRPR